MGLRRRASARYRAHVPVNPASFYRPATASGASPVPCLLWVRPHAKRKTGALLSAVLGQAASAWDHYQRTVERQYRSFYDGVERDVAAVGRSLAVRLTPEPCLLAPRLSVPRAPPLASTAPAKPEARPRAAPLAADWQRSLGCLQGNAHAAKSTARNVAIAKQYLAEVRPLMKPHEASRSLVKPRDLRLHAAWRARAAAPSRRAG